MANTMVGVPKIGISLFQLSSSSKYGNVDYIYEIGAEIYMCSPPVPKIMKNR